MRQTSSVFFRIGVFILAVLGVTLSCAAFYQGYVARLLESASPEQSKKILERVGSCRHCSAADYLKLASLQHLTTRGEGGASGEGISGCEALKYARKAMQVDPLNGRAVLAYAYYLNDLGGACNFGDGSSGTALFLVREAIDANPHNPHLLFDSALFLISVEERKEGFELLRRYLLYADDVDRPRRELIITQIRSGAELVLVIPDRLTQAIEWSRFAQFNLPGLKKRWNKEFTQIQLAALHQVAQIAQMSASRQRFVAEQLSALLSIEIASEVRVKVDELLAEYYKDRNSAATQYYSNRASLKNLVVEIGFAFGDLRPEKRALARWGKRWLGQLGSRNNSVGFFLPSGQVVRMIELSLKRSNLAGGGSVQVFTSPNNRDWRRLNVQPEPAPVTQGEMETFIFTIKGRSDLYWKFYFRTAEGDRLSIVDSLQFLKVFGLGSGGFDGA